MSLRISIAGALIALVATVGVADARGHLRRRRSQTAPHIALTAPPASAPRRRIPLLTPHGAPPVRGILDAPSYFDMHSARVYYDLFLFYSTPREVPSYVFSDPTDDQPSSLEHSRARDRLLLFRGTRASAGNFALGFGVFSAAMGFSAHAPRQLRFLLDYPLHMGPAIFDVGGMGMAAGLKF